MVIGCGITHTWRQQEIEGGHEGEKVIRMVKSMMGMEMEKYKTKGRGGE